MASLFDPSTFIAAEQRETLATIAGPRAHCDSATGPQEWRKSAISEPERGEQSQQSQQSQPLRPENEIWTAGPRLLEALPRPNRMKQTEWKRLLRLTKWIADDWAMEAERHSWHPLEFFGCNPDPFVGRVDRNGVVASVFRMAVPVEITGVYHDHVELTANGRDVMRYRPFGPRGQVPLWVAYAMNGGP